MNFLADVTCITLRFEKKLNFFPTKSSPVIWLHSKFLDFWLIGDVITPTLLLNFPEETRNM